MPNFQQLWKWMHQARAWFRKQLRAHGPYVGTGIGLLVVTLVVAVGGVLGLKVGKLGEQDAWVFLGVVGVFTFLAWGLITFDPEAQSKAKQREQPAAPAPPVCQPPTEEFARQAGEAFGGLSLLERTDEDRRRVADVVAIAQFLRLERAGRYDYINFFTHLQKFVNLPAHGDLHV